MSVLILAILATALVPSRAAQARDDRVSIVSRIPAEGINGSFVDTKARRLYLLGEGKLQILDVDSLSVLATLPIGATVATVDETAHVLYVAIGGSVTSPPSIAVIDGVGLRELPNRIPVQTTAVNSPFPQNIFGISVTPDRKLVVATGAFTAVALGAGVPVSLVQLDANSVLQGAAVPEWIYRVDGCVALLRGLGNVPGVPSDPAVRTLYLPCSYPSASLVSGPRPHQGVFKFNRGLGTAPPQVAAFTPVAGDFNFGGALFDPGSERMVLFTRRYGPRGAIVFDGRRGLVIGLVSQDGDLGGACVDTTTGRFYAVTNILGESLNQGLLLGELRTTPIPQGAAFVELNDHIQSGTMGCDPATRRVFYLDMYEEKRVVTVVKDGIPAYVPPPKINPDALTSDVAEDESTSITYNGVGRGFGARVIDVGGAVRVGSGFFSVFADQAATLQLGTLGVTRSISFGAVGVDSTSVSLTNSSAGSAALGILRDHNTRADMTKNAGERDPWPYPLVDCAVGSGGEKQQRSGVGATATCDPGSSAHGTSAGEGDLGPVAIVGAVSNVRARLDPARGVVTTAHASVRSVSIPEANAVLENVRSFAESEAKGRPGTAKTVHRAEIGRLVVNGQEQCAPCSPEQAAEILNRLPQQVVRVTVPRTSEDQARGTPKGANAAVLRDPFEQLNDQVLNEVSPNDQHVAALRIALVSDHNFQHKALILDLAGVQVASLRAISPCAFCGSTWEDDPTPPVFDTPDAVPSVLSPDLPTDVDRQDDGGGDGGGGKSGLAGVADKIVEGAKAIARGIRAAFASPARIPMLLLVWSVFAVPVYLSARRRLLVVSTAPRSQ